MKIIFFISFILLTFKLFSWEVDQYTYRNVPLQDIAQIIEAEFSKDLLNVISAANREILKSKTYLSDSNIEFLLSREYQNTININMFNNKWELCVYHNNCYGWPKLERILLLKGESVFAEADFYKMINNNLMATANVCGIRMGADKLAHMLIAGFRLYNIWNDNRKNYSESDIEKMILFEEETLMGGGVTGVVSYADGEADLQGFRMFRELFFEGKYFSRIGEKGFLKLKKEVSLCSYITENFDETINESKFKGKRILELKKVILKRLEDNNVPDEEEIKRILARKADPNIFKPEIFFFGTLYSIKNILTGNIQKNLDALLKVLVKPDPRHRKETKWAESLLQY